MNTGGAALPVMIFPARSKDFISQPIPELNTRNFGINFGIKLPLRCKLQIGSWYAATAFSLSMDAPANYFSTLRPRLKS